MNRGVFVWAYKRLHGESDGVSIVETAVALGVLFIALVALAFTASIGFTDVALARQRQTGNQFANKVLEQVRGLSYERVGQGLATSDLVGDPNIVTCADGAAYYKACPTTNPNAEKIVHTAGLGNSTPLVPHRQTHGPPTYTQTYRTAVYVTQAKNVPAAGAYRVTAVATWDPTTRGGTAGSVTTQSLLYTAQGITDTTTGGGEQAFFYGTADVGRAPVKVTPNAGVSGGTGIAGLPAWDAMTEELYGLSANVQQQQLTRTESKTVMTGATTVTGGNEATSGGETANAIADNDPATADTSSSSPSALTQFNVNTSVSGGGNSLSVGASSGTPGGACPPEQPTINWMSGFEHGRLTTGMGPATVNMHGLFFQPAGSFTADATVKRTGNYSLKVTAANTVSRGTFILPWAGQQTTLHFAMRLASLPTTDVQQLAGIRPPTGTSYSMFLGYQASTQRFVVRLRNSAGVLSAPVASSSAVSAGQWYAIDMKWDTSTATHRGDWQIDGVPQTQVTHAGATQGQSNYYVDLGTNTAATFVANYDDVLYSNGASDYPIADGGIKLLRPDAMGTSNIGTTIKDESLQTSTLPNWWAKFDEVPPSASDWIVQTTANTANYAEVTFENATDTCIRAVEALLWSASTGANKPNNGQFRLLDGGVERTVWNSNLGQNLGGAGSVHGMGATIPPSGTTWTQAAVNGLRGRVGYSNNVAAQPRWDALTIQYFAPYVSAGTEGGSPGTESGETASTTAASAGTPCGSPTQVDGRACAYAEESYAPAGSPYLRMSANLAGSSAGTAKLYTFRPPDASATSYAWGRRIAGSGGAGAIRETAVRYPGSHEFASLPSVMTTGPVGWNGYLVKYDAGNAAASVSAEAGVGSSDPTLTSVGTISYWDGDSTESMSPPLDGGPINIGTVDHEANGFRVQISGSLATGPSHTSEAPAGLSGSANRIEGRAQLGAPITGELTYKVTNTSTGAVIMDVTIDVDLGSLTAATKYAV